MDWADEHYVKLFTRDTVTWLEWPWQARAVLALVIRKVDAAGFIDIGKREPSQALAVLLGMPRDVVDPGLAALLESGTVEVVGSRLLLSNFVSAQESRKTDKAKARDYRERKKAHARSEATGKVAESITSTVTERHTASPVVTSTNPPALLCSALLKKNGAEPKRERKPSAAEEFFAWLRATRAAKTRFSDSPIGPSLVNKTFGAALTQHGRPTCERAYVAFLALPEPAAMDPPWPWQSFIARLPVLATKPSTSQPESLAL